MELVIITIWMLVIESVSYNDTYSKKCEHKWYLFLNILLNFEIASVHLIDPV